MQNKVMIGVANGAAAGALWGLIFLMPEVLHAFSALQLAAARYLAYGIVAALLLLPRWRRATASLGRAEWLALLWLSLLGNIVYYICIALAVQLAGVPATSIIIGFLPVAVAIIGAREVGAVTLRALAGPLALGITGVVLIGAEGLLAPRAEGGDPWLTALGLLCAVGALASWTIYSIGNSRWLLRRPDISAHDWSLLTGVVTGGTALVLAVPAFWDAGSNGDQNWMLFWSVSAAIAVLASVIGNGFWNRASRLLPLTLMGQMIIFETVFALLYGFLWAQRWPTLIEAVSALLLVGGVAWCARLHRGH